MLDPFSGERVQPHVERVEKRIQSGLDFGANSHGGSDVVVGRSPLPRRLAVAPIKRHTHVHGRPQPKEAPARSEFQLAGRS